MTVALLAGCGGGGTGSPSSAPAGAPNVAAAAAPTVQITGLAATGAAIANATVTGTNARGEKATAATNSAGNFVLNIADAAPFLLQVTDAAGKAWFSYAPTAGVSHINPVTTLALLQANGNKPLADLVASWGTRQLSANQVLEAAKVANANLAAVMQSKGINPAAANPFNVNFTANGQGFDAVLDAMRVNITCGSTACTQSITGPAGNLLVNWNANVSTSAISLNWAANGSSGTLAIGFGSCKAPRAGTYSLVVQTSISGLGAMPIPEVCIDGLPAKPATQAEFCGSSTVTGQLPAGVQVISCTWDGSSGSISARITQPFVVDYSITYRFVQR